MWRGCQPALEEIAGEDDVTRRLLGHEVIELPEDGLDAVLATPNRTHQRQVGLKVRCERTHKARAGRHGSTSVTSSPTERRSSSAAFA